MAGGAGSSGGGGSGGGRVGDGRSGSLHGRSGHAACQAAGTLELQDPQPLWLRLLLPPPASLLLPGVLCKAPALTQPSPAVGCRASRKSGTQRLFWWPAAWESGWATQVWPAGWRLAACSS
jgi:hypothetical protein